MSNRWTANKLGLFNFWYYDEQEFELSDGKVLFRGSNGSGKSVTTQSFIPLILDGNKHPRRLDPFGSTSRKIDNYIIYGEHETRISYLYTEFKKPESETYITIGMGFWGRKGKPLETWYFILKDGRRINVDFKLYEGVDERLALNKQKFKNRLGDGNFFTEKQREYKQKVNEHLFGYSDIEDYDQLLNLLIEVRSPKLSKDFKPTKIYEILKSALKTLSDNDLIPMAEAMDNMDRLNEALDQCHESLKACKKVKKSFDDYNEYVVFIKAKNLINSDRKLTEITNEKNELLNSVENFKKQNIKDKEELILLEDELEKAQIEYEKLNDNDTVRVKVDLDKSRKEIDFSEKQLQEEEMTYEKKRDKELELNIAIRELEKDIDYDNDKLVKELNELEILSREAQFEDGYRLKDEVLKDIEDYDIKHIRNDLNRYSRILNENKKLIEEYEKIKNEYDIRLKKQDHLERNIKFIKDELDESTEYLTNTKEEYVEQLNMYSKMTKEFKLRDEQLKNIFRKIYEVNKEENLLNLGIQDIYHELKNRLDIETNTLDRNIEEIRKDIDKTSRDIKNLKNQEEIEYPKSEEVLKNRELILEHKLPHISFSRAFDFKKNITEDEKSIIEMSLVDMSLIDSLIVPNEYKDKLLGTGLKDKYIFNNNNGEFLKDENIKTLYDYLDIEKNDFSDKYKNELISTLKSIVIDDTSNTSININGSYKIGLLEGRASKNIPSKYIGEESRKRHRELLIKEKQQQVKEMSVHIEDINESINVVENKKETLNKEYIEFPKTEDIKSNLEQIRDNEYKLNRQEDEYINLEQEIKVIKESIDNLRAEIFDKTKNIDIEKSTERYNEVIELLADYLFQFGNIPGLLYKVRSNNRLINHKKDNLDDILYEIDNIFRKISIMKEKLRGEKIEYEVLEQVLLNSNLGEIEEAIEKAIKIKEENPRKTRELSNKISRAEQKIEIDKENIEKKERVIEKEKSINELRYNILESEFSLRYTNIVGETLIEKAKNTVKSYREDEKKDINTYSRMLMEKVSENTGMLREYNIKQMERFISEEEFEMEELKEISKSARRIDISLKYAGRDISLYEMINQLNDDIEFQKMMIGDEERKIFEDILIKTISAKITSKIYQTQQWVDSMNNLMESMDTSNGIKFNLKWKPKRSSNDTQVDISKLVNILKVGERVSEEDIGLLSSHFKESLKLIKRDNEESGKTESYQSIIKDILDYREWYNFTLYCTKPLEGKKEMTDSEFFKLSGGEKAMAMYVPLFAAVNARYNSADKKDCPRLVALDEAFAGVDENNINDMFRLIESLDLDYVLNSQVLWGDYQSVNTLAIYELIRGKEDDIVSVIPYNWNGKEKICCV